MRPLVRGSDEPGSSFFTAGDCRRSCAASGLVIAMSVRYDRTQMKNARFRPRKTRVPSVHVPGTAFSTLPRFSNTCICIRLRSDASSCEDQTTELLPHGTASGFVFQNTGLSAGMVVDYLPRPASAADRMAERVRTQGTCTAASSLAPVIRNGEAPETASAGNLQISRSSRCTSA
jgi:hypothetical protein